MFKENLDFPSLSENFPHVSIIFLLLLLGTPEIRVVVGQGVRTAAPWDVRARDEHMQMAKEIKMAWSVGWW